MTTASKCSTTRERVVEVVQRGAPLLVGRRAPETLGVVLQALPLDQEQEAAGSLEAALDPQRDEARAGGDVRLAASIASTKASSCPGMTSRSACSVITRAEQPGAQRRVGGGVDGRPGQGDGAVAHGGVGRRGDAGGGELALVVDGAVGLNADERVDGGDGERDVGHVGRERRRRRPVVVGVELPAERLGVDPVGLQEGGVGLHVRVHGRQLLVVERATGGECARLEAGVDPGPQRGEALRPCASGPCSGP